MDLIFNKRLTRCLACKAMVLGCALGSLASVSPMAQATSPVAKSQFAVSAHGTEAAATTPEKQAGLTRLLVRDRFLERSVKACGEVFPSAKQRWDERYGQWQTHNKSSRDAAERHLQQSFSNNGMESMNEALRRENAALQALLVEIMGKDLTVQPTLAQCGQVLDRLTQLPVP